MLHRLTALLTRLAYWILAALADFGEHKLIPIIETDVLPDFLLRFGIRLLLKKKLRDIGASDPVSARFRKQREFVRRCANTERLALKTDQANEQHYEIPAAWCKWWCRVVVRVASTIPLLPFGGCVRLCWNPIAMIGIGFFG